MMLLLTLKVLAFRYAYVTRQRWFLTVCYLAFPLILCLLGTQYHELFQTQKYRSRIQEHDERSLLQTKPIEDDQENTTMKIIVCPGGAEQRKLVDLVSSLLRRPNSSAALEVRYVDSSEQLEHTLLNQVKKKGYPPPKGLHFLEISRSKLEYKIRPPVLASDRLRYDWWDFASKRFFPSPMLRGPRLTDGYLHPHGGFLKLLVAVDKAYIKIYHPNVSYQWLLSSFPHPDYHELAMRIVISHEYILSFVKSLLLTGNLVMISVFASYTISDKVGGIRELMCLNGANRWLVNLSWLISFSFEATLLAFLQVLILKTPFENGQTIAYMSGSVLMLVLVIHYWLTLCWVQLLSSVLKKKILCIVVIIAYWMFAPLERIPQDKFIVQGLLATLPNAGLTLIFKSFQEFDGAETVLGLSSLATKPIHYLPVGTLLLTMITSTVLLILLGIYTDLVLPGPYGRAKPWYLFEKEDTTHEHLSNQDSPSKEKYQYFEDIGQDSIGLECVGISKSFQTRTIPCHSHKAVSNVDLKIPKNKITILLGPNGAGKTTLFSILCGMYSPSKGECYTEYYEIFRGDNITKFRKVLGYCPQSNLLMDELTVRQHLILFGMLKGLPRDEADEYSDEWTERFKIEKFRNTRAKQLSGGTKRKLCLAMAMTGDPLYLLLDEPSAGLDIKSRRTFWNILMAEKKYSTVVMSTHDMDEAEVLGDRIALLANGRLVGYGSSSFLKIQLGTGYKLNCAFNEKTSSELFAFIEQFDPSISILYKTRNTVTLGFPQSKSKSIPSFLKSLESKFGNEIATSLSHSTLDDVFIEFNSESNSHRSPNPDDIPEINPDDFDRSCNCGQVGAIFKKKTEWIYNQNLITVILMLLILPFIGVELAMYSVKEILEPQDYQTADLILSMRSYKGTTAFINNNDSDNLNVALMRAMKNEGITVKKVDQSITYLLRESAKKSLFEYRSRMVFAFESSNSYGVSTAYYSRNAFHSAPMAYSALMNAILHGRTTITAHNFPYSAEGKGDICSMNKSDERRILTLIALMVPFLLLLGPVLLIAGSYFVIFPQTERRTLFKHLQLTTGLLPLVYWTSHLIFDLLMFSVSVLLIVIIMATDKLGLFSNRHVLLALISVLLLYGLSVITLAYAFSFFRCSTTTTMIWFIAIPPLFLLVYGLLWLFILFTYKGFLPFTYLNVVPWLILMKSLAVILIKAYDAKVCYDCQGGDACSGFTASLIDSLKYDLVYFVIHSLLYLSFIIVMDHGLGRKLKPMYQKMLPSEIKSIKGYIDPEVGIEKERVRYLVVAKNADQPELIADGLWKKHSHRIIAVRDVTFAVERGHLFGLLGANGSGKTTTLLILSGVMSPTIGSAAIGGKWDLTDCEYKYIRNIGFCPQYGGLLFGLSGRNTLKLFACLRGLKSSIRDSHVDMWLQALDMLPLADQPCNFYSAGNKRKLSFAIAMIGCPSVVLLDEPTAGIDPFVRRRIWGIFNKRHPGQAVVLTSHTMSECEAICDRITFMVNGKMICLGTVTDLKNKFGKSCTLRVKLQNYVTPEQSQVIMKKILEGSRFSSYAKLEDEQTNVFTIHIELERIKAHEVFANMMSIKEANSSIDDFTLTETSLEQVFSSFIEDDSKKREKDKGKEEEKKKPEAVIESK